jgi:hypothetical protein
LLHTARRDQTYPIAEIVIVDKGKEFFQMRTDPASVVLYGVTKKQSRQE